MHAGALPKKVDWISGDHHVDGVIVATGPSVRPFESQPLLVDMAPTILAALGALAWIGHSGRVLHEVVGSEAKVEAKAAVQIPGMPRGHEESTVTDTEADEMEEHIRDSATSSRGDLRDLADTHSDIDPRDGIGLRFGIR